MSGYLPISQSSEMSNFDSSAVDLLTPSTLVSLEQAFSAYGTQKPGSMPSEAFSSSPAYIHTILPAVAGPVMAIKQEYSEDFSSEDSDASSSWTMSPATMQGRVSDADSSTSLHFASHANNSTSGPKGRGSRSRNRANDPYLTPDELARKQQRRERNKQAAARCRQRRVDLTNKLEAECEVLEEEKRKLQRTIDEVRQQKEHLEFLLEAHKPVCSSGAKLTVNAAAAAVSHVALNAIPKQSSDVHVVAPKLYTPPVAATSLDNSRQMGVANAAPAAPASLRPSTLMLPKRGTGDDAAAGSASSDFFPTMGLDLMLEGHTGLTPLTTTAAPVSAAGLLSCTNQQYQRAANPTGSTSENTSALMAL